MRVLPLALSLAGLVAGCGPIGITVPVCQTLPDQQVPGTRLSVYGQVERDQTIDLREQLEGVGSKLSQVELTSITLTPRAGITDFDWIDEANLHVKNADGSRDRIASYRKVEGAPPTTSLKIESDASVDVLPQLRSGPLDVVLDFTGALPAGDWSVDVKTCASARAMIIE